MLDAGIHPTISDLFAYKTDRRYNCAAETSTWGWMISQQNVEFLLFEGSRSRAYLVEDGPSKRMDKVLV